jgi:pimeloyl-ACP methyl ester carboxylesterase
MSSPAVPESRFITIDNLKLHYLEWGDSGKPVLLFLHGLSGCAFDWVYTAGFLQDTFRCIALTNRGHGDSQWAEVSRYTFQDFAVEIALFLDVLGIKELSVLGSSMGGLNGIYYAATHPERVKKLIVSDVPPEFNAEWMGRWPLILQGVRSHFGSFEEFFQLMRMTRDPLATEEKVRGFASYATKTLSDGRIAWKHDVEMEKAFYRAFIRDSKALLLGGRPETNWWQFLSMVRCETLLLRGGESSLLDHEMILKMTAAMQRAEMREVEGSDHVLFWDKPDEFNAIVKEFLTRA